MSDLEERPRPLLVEVLRLIRHNRTDLEKIGLRHADIFGSVARGEDESASDVDILVDLDPEIVGDLFAYSRVQRTLQELIGRPVDITPKNGKRQPEMAAEIARDAVNVY
ncbi:nucleotidyltransferase family protein [Bradyrhizobium japonicum]|uniref:nucleotidyltransferase family protein n=1 Tax=Bradyrhizobium japonicum TaxID=375 RepID=UPI0004A270F9|nr:nucleotidyltransferase domain-containing protein [Bradyrhizobium japonicum]